MCISLGQITIPSVPIFHRWTFKRSIHWGKEDGWECVREGVGVGFYHRPHIFRYLMHCRCSTNTGLMGGKFFSPSHLHPTPFKTHPSHFPHPPRPPAHIPPYLVYKYRRKVKAAVRSCFGVTARSARHWLNDRAKCTTTRPAFIRCWLKHPINPCRYPLNTTP